jgi:hypothetical protein
MLRMRSTFTREIFRISLVVDKGPYRPDAIIENSRRVAESRPVCVGL